MHHPASPTKKNPPLNMKRPVSYYKPYAISLPPEYLCTLTFPLGTSSRAEAKGGHAMQIPLEGPKRTSSTTDGAISSPYWRSHGSNRRRLALQGIRGVAHAIRGGDMRRPSQWIRARRYGDVTWGDRLNDCMRRAKGRK
jgi:hypothetical protein